MAESAGDPAQVTANLVAQSQALMQGKTADEAREEMRHKGMDEARIEELVAARSFAGGRPSNTLLLRDLSPYRLGMLIAAYEHRTFVQGVIWDVDSFDQWGVELGKQLGKGILDRLLSESGQVTEASDSSTDNLLRLFRSR